MTDSNTPGKSASNIAYHDVEQRQFRNIQKVVREIARFNFVDSQNTANISSGSAYLATIHSLTAKDGISLSRLNLEPLVVNPAKLLPESPSDSDMAAAREFLDTIQDNSAAVKALSFLLSRGEEIVEMAAITDDVKKALLDARQSAMNNFNNPEASIPVSAEFAAIAQNLDFACSQLIPSSGKSPAPKI